jgi:NAD(P)-dependent dehydrogenase (short-subunit alcohol dehydrogenase family)
MRLARDGLTVIVVDIDNPADAAAGITATGGSSSAYACDVTDQRAVAALAGELEATYSGVDILVNCAGMFPQMPFADTDLDMWEHVLDVNLTSVFLMCKSFVPAMAQRGHGRVVNISSGTFFVPAENYSAYISAKAGVIGLSRALASEYGPHGVTVNTIAPGLIRTLTSEKLVEADQFARVLASQAIPREGQTSDIASTVAFLASEEASFITGQTLMVDGGLVRL